MPSSLCNAMLATHPQLYRIYIPGANCTKTSRQEAHTQHRGHHRNTGVLFMLIRTADTEVRDRLQTDRVETGGGGLDGHCDGFFKRVGALGTAEPRRREKLGWKGWLRRRRTAGNPVTKSCRETVGGVCSSVTEKFCHRLSALLGQRPKYTLLILVATCTTLLLLHCFIVVLANHEYKACQGASCKPCLYALHATTPDSSLKVLLHCESTAECSFHAGGEG